MASNSTIKHKNTLPAPGHIKNKKAEFAADWAILDDSLREFCCVDSCGSHTQNHPKLDKKHNNKQQNYMPYTPIHVKSPRDCLQWIVALFGHNRS
jgi:hypothetical protein